MLAAIDGVRQVGNIGAHMQKDINHIVDVEPGEAQLLIGLIETLLEETYVRKHERAKKLAAIAQLAVAKAAERKGGVKPSGEG